MRRRIYPHKARRCSFRKLSIQAGNLLFRLKSADRGGDLGFNAPKLFVPEFADALKKLEVGKISDPVKTQFGYHIIKLEEKKENYEDFKEQIQAQMEKESYNAYILGIFKKAKIELAK